MSPEAGGQILTPEQEFIEAKDAADKLFAEAGFEIARVLTAPDSIETIAGIPVEDLEVPVKEAKTSTGLMKAALITYIENSFDNYLDADSREWFDSLPEFKKVAKMLAACQHEDPDIKKLQKRYERPADNLLSNFVFITEHFVGAYLRIPEHISKPQALTDSQKPYRQIGKLYDYQQRRIIMADELTWDEDIKQLRIRNLKGMSEVRKEVEEFIDLIWEGTGLTDPRPPYAYKRGCAGLRKPEGETDDAFNIMWEWLAQTVTDPRLQHLLGAKEALAPIEHLA